MNNDKLKVRRKDTFVSILLFFIPTYIAFIQEKYFFAVSLILLILFSALYHIYKPNGPDWWHKKGRTRMQTFLLWADTIMALLVSASVLVIFWYRNFPPSFWLAIALFIPCFIMFMRPNRHYERNHMIWHICCVIVVTLAFF